jgi:aerobic-type carbon monoxide dehydrogenase small subunit (CoxS/CutS family)
VDIGELRFEHVQFHRARRRPTERAACGRNRRPVSRRAVAWQIPARCYLLGADADIENAMDGNVCRCATYIRMRADIHEASRMLG